MLVQVLLLLLLGDGGMDLKLVLENLSLYQSLWEQMNCQMTP